MMEKFQKFGGAIFTPVLLFTFSGIMVALTIVFTNPAIVGSIANEGTLWTDIWTIFQNGAWTVFTQMEILFAIGLPLGLAKKASGRAALSSFVLYITFTYFVSSFIQFFGPFFGVDFSAEPGGQSGLKLIAGIKTLDIGVLGAILVAAIVVWVHNRYFEKKLPDFLGIFQGSSFVCIVGFFVMFALAFLMCLIWPKVQNGIVSLQGVMTSSGAFGVWLFTFLERILIPTGLHHFVATPFLYGPAVVEGGITRYWMEHVNEFAQSTKPMIDLFPEGGFALTGNGKIFAPVGIAAAFYATAKPDKKKKVLTLLIPITLTAVVAGITEPLEFTFLFVAPMLFAVHAFLSATMAVVMYKFGVVGDLGAGMIEQAAKTWIPLAQNHWQTYVLQFVIGIVFIGIYFIVFRTLILKFDLATPGREIDSDNVKFYSKKEYKEKQAKAGSDAFQDQAAGFIEALGGKENIDTIANCATRLRVKVKDEEQLASDAVFRDLGAHGVVRKGKSVQIIVGLDVPMVKAQADLLLKGTN
ncbi:alpha-glucoside-specific PTS transporter subunit IIBC [Enterococcus hulanensis]|uniref:Alpha-glucoside-specific PTS transporter subunit IIBC n=1 Tax=Enterococcus hulanensis TaxID=2559929 RepID=A0ABU3F0W3_9ENTE|nr:alpha-glucoside-specific PTS transporter subunit IIBC [Enterococcus hulanensis]MDT2600153.1 alpha-glucoside-specific PTS transporter subunit IIBC [Enterococcus hulanensis]MDT2608966.1 alpha-glucoside-specific PTS transporter subunit IIBC [Enterococcus hulanensis]MDT2616992.1 alpha-glucoside-specific PTS transporter subunit IIBC [Enterococcus hulanensis]MDT2628488.1 alpha-glucoside-specific PTS transporter subunit IIBC [Enterococcus hulanensis]MDT2655828.1 alpha-glucoside-specific PTS transp